MLFINQATWTSSGSTRSVGSRILGYGRELGELGIGEFVNKKLVRVA